MPRRKRSASSRFALYQASRRVHLLLRVRRSSLMQRYRSLIPQFWVYIGVCQLTHRHCLSRCGRSCSIGRRIAMTSPLSRTLRKRSGSTLSRRLASYRRRSGLQRLTLGIFFTTKAGTVLRPSLGLPRCVRPYLRPGPSGSSPSRSSVSRPAPRRFDGSDGRQRTRFGSPEVGCARRGSPIGDWWPRRPPPRSHVPTSLSPAKPRARRSTGGSYPLSVNRQD